MKKTYKKTYKKSQKTPTPIELCLSLAFKAGKLLIKKQKKIAVLKITNKVAQGVASDADIESEQLIIKGIKKFYPEHLILAEESAYTEFNGEKNRFNFLQDKEWVWVIDPLDGTNNYLSESNENWLLYCTNGLIFCHLIK